MTIRREEWIGKEEKIDTNIRMNEEDKNTDNIFILY